MGTMAMKRSFKQCVEQKFGKIPSFVIHVILEWILIAILFIDGLIAFAANEFARFFDLQIPCLLCTRIDHVLVPRNPEFYYNDSICESHRKDVSSKAFCHVHKRLSDIQQMCEACLLSFATENKPSDDPYKSLVAILGADLDEHDHKHAVSEEEDLLKIEKSSIHRCSCCGEPLRVKATFQQALVRSLTMNRADVPQAPTPSPRGQVTTKNEESRGLDLLPHIRYAELKFVSDTESEIPEDEEGSITSLPDGQLGREDPKAATVPLLTESEDYNEDACKTPNFIRTSRFFGMTPSSSATASPRWLARLPRKLLPEKTDSGTEPLEGNSANNIDGETLHNLKRQVRFDRKSLIALYMELDEERNASAVAANQAMAMITRLQAEKAAIEMEALQYQRMMEEQAEYDQQALQDMKEQLTKREEEIKVLEEELDSYRLRLGCEETIDADDYQESNHGPVSSISGKSECGSSQPILDEEVDKLERASSDQTGPSLIENGLGIVEELTLDLEFERNYLLDRLRMLEKTHSTPNDGVHLTPPSSDITKEEDKGNCSSTTISREISDVNERLDALEIDKEFLKHAVRALQKGDEGTQLLKEIAQHLRELRHREKKPLEVVAA